jgi:outer membrane biosynthesis protein TonB
MPVITFKQLREQSVYQVQPWMEKVYNDGVVCNDLSFEIRCMEDCMIPYNKADAFNFVKDFSYKCQSNCPELGERKGDKRTWLVISHHPDIAQVDMSWYIKAGGLAEDGNLKFTLCIRVYSDLTMPLAKIKAKLMYCLTQCHTASMYGMTGVNVKLINNYTFTLTADVFYIEYQKHMYKSTMSLQEWLFEDVRYFIEENTTLALDSHREHLSQCGRYMVMQLRVKSSDSSAASTAKYLTSCISYIRITADADAEAEEAQEDEDTAESDAEAEEAQEEETEEAQEEETEEVVAPTEEAEEVVAPTEEVAKKVVAPTEEVAKKVVAPTEEVAKKVVAPTEEVAKKVVAPMEEVAKEVVAPAAAEEETAEEVVARAAAVHAQLLYDAEYARKLQAAEDSFQSSSSSKKSRKAAAGRNLTVADIVENPNRVRRLTASQADRIINELKMDDIIKLVKLYVGETTVSKFVIALRVKAAECGFSPRS